MENLNFNFQNLNSKISFTVPRFVEPLQPLVSAAFNEGVVYVSSVIFLDSSLTLNQDSFRIIQDSITTSPTFYIEYNVQETQSESFSAYQLNFQFEVDPQNVPKEIELFLRDLDPVTSRGTSTTIIK